MAAVFEGDEEAVEDGAGAFPADAGGAAEELVDGVAEVGEELGDGPGGGGGFVDGFLRARR